MQLTRVRGDNMFKGKGRRRRLDYWKQLSRPAFLGLLNLRGLMKPYLDVFWEPTPFDVVAEVCRFTGFRKTDVVYDLGCGDGRIVVAAARRTGARGVGIDLDPQRIDESNESARRAGVEGLVRFMEQDLFDADIAEATAVVLFLYPDVNLRLRPKLLSELKPGTRVVSYCHSMEWWQPDRTIKVRHNWLYYWTVPANFHGRWEGKMDRDGSDTVPLNLVIEQEFQRIDGKVLMEDRSTPLHGKVAGDILRATMLFKSPGGPMDVHHLEATIAENTMTGVIRNSSRQAVTSRWTAGRAPGTRVAIAK
jgi:SAM-dependent methyltransferase